uniref:Uncharacterized protein n=1 Tax=Solanum tuberosum TaxID=4113 RepID=M1DI31_SOLTU
MTMEDNDRGLAVFTRSGKVAIGDVTGNKKAQTPEEDKGMEEEETPIHQSIAKGPQKEMEKHNPITKVHDIVREEDAIGELPNPFSEHDIVRRMDFKNGVVILEHSAGDLHHLVNR